MAHTTKNWGAFNIDPKMFENFKNKPSFDFDREKLMKSHRKNIEALTEAHKKAAEVMKSLAQLQSQYMKKTFEDITAVMKDMVHPNDQGDPIAKNSSAVKNHIERTLEHGKAISSALAQTHHDIYKIFHDRMTSGMKEARESAKAFKKKTH